MGMILPHMAVFTWECHIGCFIMWYMILGRDFRTRDGSVDIFMHLHGIVIFLSPRSRVDQCIELILVTKMEINYFGGQRESEHVDI
jgi:hypothetical protein